MTREFMMIKTVSKGVLNKTYAYNRVNKPELIFRHKVRARVAAGAVRRYLRRYENLKILDFGSAEGLALTELNKLLPNNQIDGVEYSGELINCAPMLPDNIKIVQGDVSNLHPAFKKQNYDVVCALALLEHLPGPVKAVREAASCLKAGGLFIATCPSPFWEDVSIKLGFLDDEQHATKMTKNKLIGVVERGGLEVLNCQRFMWAPVSFLPYLKLNISPSNSLTIDNKIRKLGILNWW